MNASAIRPISFELAKRQYVHRFTLDHVPAWAGRAHRHTDGPHKGRDMFYAPQFRSDAEWYANTTFPGEGHLHRCADHCETNNQSWPLGKWLETPFRKGA